MNAIKSQNISFTKKRNKVLLQPDAIKVVHESFCSLFCSLFLYCSFICRWVTTYFNLNCISAFLNSSVFHLSLNEKNHFRCNSVWMVIHNASDCIADQISRNCSWIFRILKSFFPFFCQLSLLPRKESTLIKFKALWNICT